MLLIDEFSINAFRLKLNAYMKKLDYDTYSAVMRGYYYSFDSRIDNVVDSIDDELFDSYES